MFEFQIDNLTDDSKSLLESTLRVLKQVYNCDVKYKDTPVIELTTPVKTYDAWSKEKAEYIVNSTGIKPLSITTTETGKECYHFESITKVWDAGKQFDKCKKTIVL